MSDALQAFGEVDFSYVRPLDSVWADAPYDVDDLNRQVLDAIVADFFRQTRDPKTRPIGQVAVGTAGIGKTHLIGRLRQRVWERGGWFVLLDIIGLKDFWTSTALCFANALQQQMPGGDTQGQALLAAIAGTFNIESQVRAALAVPTIDLRELIDILLRAMVRDHGFAAQQHADVFRALVLFCSRDFAAGNIAYAWLQGMPGEDAACRALGFLAAQRAPVDLVRGVSWIMSLTGPTLCAVDQIDALMNADRFAGSGDQGGDFDEQLTLADVLAAGLVDLHDKRHRGMTVVTCLEVSWTLLDRRAPPAFKARFAMPPKLLLGLKDAASVARLIENRLAPAYAEAGFKPPYPTWPFSAEATHTAVGLLPRQILMRCEDHRRACLDAGEISECHRLPEIEAKVVPKDTHAEFDIFLARHRTEASIDGLLDDTSDAAMGDLVRDMLGLYVKQLPLNPDVDAETLSDARQKRPPLHGRLTFTFHAANDRQRHYCFRAVEHTNAIAFQARLNAALTAAGIDKAMSGRSLFLVRRAPVPGGPRTKKLEADFLRAGGQVIDPSDEDLATFVALRQMRDEAGPAGRQEAFEAWLRTAKPLCGTAFFQLAGLCPPPDGPDGPATGPAPGTAPPQPPDHPTAPTEPASSDGGGRNQAVSPPDAFQATARTTLPPTTLPPTTIIPVGTRLTATEDRVGIPVALLPRHTAIIAGSGSGKTVLLRRIVEEAALAGIPAIVVDSNNDLSRLGDPWPARPAGFTAEDDAKASRYRDAVEVVVWTPGVRAGNPLFLSVMPDFAALGDDPDERQQAVTMAEETLGPLAGVRSNLQRGVLADALRRFSATGGGDLSALTGLLADLPDGVSAIGKAAQLAVKMADELLASVATNPLLKVDGPVLDPARLFFGPDAARTRVSVVNLSGLGSDVARQDFVNRLQMTLFGWIKRHPSPSGLLYVIDEAQNFLPSVQPALSRLSGVQLVTQARKYGLGMIVATQAPRGIDNKVVSNCTTQFFGKQNAPATIQAAQEIIAASGGRADDIGKLKAGEFYFATEGSGRPGKIRTPVCLTDHPPNPPTPEEVIARARRSMPAAG